jgi:hypothetical protein
MGEEDCAQTAILGIWLLQHTQFPSGCCSTLSFHLAVAAHSVSIWLLQHTQFPSGCCSTLSFQPSMWHVVAMGTNRAAARCT